MTAMQQLLELFKQNMSSDWFHIDEIEQTINSVGLDLEKQQLGNTWDAAIKAHDERGHVHARSLVDFDDYYNALKK